MKRRCYMIVNKQGTPLAYTLRAEAGWAVKASGLSRFDLRRNGYRVARATFTVGD